MTSSKLDVPQPELLFQPSFHHRPSSCLPERNPSIPAHHSTPKNHCPLFLTAIFSKSLPHNHAQLVGTQEAENLCSTSLPYFFILSYTHTSLIAPAIDLVFSSVIPPRNHSSPLTSHPAFATLLTPPLESNDVLSSGQSYRFLYTTVKSMDIKRFDSSS